MAESVRAESQTDSTKPLGLARGDPTSPAHAYHPLHLHTAIFPLLLPNSSQRQVDKITSPKCDLLTPPPTTKDQLPSYTVSTGVTGVDWVCPVLHTGLNGGEFPFLFPSSNCGMPKVRD